MAIEIEKKYRLSEDQYRQVLESLGDLKAELIREEFEINQLYGGGILEKDKAILRVRKTEHRTLLTYKRQILHDLGVKQHTEFETEVSNSAEIENIVTALGFMLKMIYEKKRQTWRLQNVDVCLDELPFGLFMEIEGKYSQIGLIEMMLELEEFTVENETYPKLTFLSGNHNDGVIESRFD